MTTSPPTPFCCLCTWRCVASGEQALISLQYRYAVVGIDEELELSLELLESALPEWFSGAAAQYVASCVGLKPWDWPGW